MEDKKSHELDSQLKNSLSIIIPTWNRANIITKCLDSIPIDPRVEVIVVDDGSVDNTKDVIANYSRFPIKYFYQENQGPGPARDLGVEHATNDYILFLDSDDELYTDNFMKSLEYLHKADLTKLKFSCSWTSGDYHYELQGNIIKKDIIKDIKHMPGRFRGEDSLYMDMVTKYKNPTTQEVDLIIYKYNNTDDKNRVFNITGGDLSKLNFYKRQFGV